MAADCERKLRRHIAAPAIPLGLVMGVVLWICGGCHSDPGRDEHLDHHVPKHRPRNFARAVRQIEKRLPAVAKGPVQGKESAWEQSVDELREIIEWLPELAADSDMRKAEWDRVQALTRRLLADYTKQVASLRGNDASAGEAWVSDSRLAIAELESLLIATVDPRLRAIDGSEGDLKSAAKEN